MKAIACGFMLLFSTLLVAQEFGKASYYNDKYQGVSTASGEAYDKNKLTCAHKTHPFGTLLKVTRIDNNKSVQVRVNDRGPFAEGRVVDLSRVAAEQVGLIRAGLAQVKVEIVGNSSTSVASAPKTNGAKGNKPSKSYASSSKGKASSSSNQAPIPSTYVDKSVPKDKPVSKVVNRKTSTGNAKLVSQSKPSQTAKPIVKDDFYQIKLRKPKMRGYGVQVASFASYDNVLNKVEELQKKWFDEVFVRSFSDDKGTPVYKVILGNFESQAAANTYKKNLKSKHKISGFVINLTD